MVTDLVVVVPGIMGSVLKYGEAEVWNTSLRTVAHDLKRFDEFTRVLRLPEGIGDGAPQGQDALAADRLIGGWHLWPGKWAGSGYHGFLEHLGNRYRGKRQVVAFAYDWRLSVRFNAERLKTFLADELGAWRVRSQNADARAILICHSMGGLIARFYINKLKGAESVSRVITLGTPYAGSVKAVLYLAGNPLFPEELTKTLRSFPALWQLLPTYRCVRTARGMAPIGASGLPGIESHMIRDALLLREESAPRGDGSASPPVHVFGGHRHGTLTSVQENFDALQFFETWLETDGGRSDESDYRGDGTVPRFSAVPTEWTDDAPAIFRAERHGALHDHVHIRELCRDKVEGLNPRSFLSDDLEIGIDLPDLVQAGKPVQVRAVTNGPQVRLEAAVTDLQGESLGQATPLRPTGDGDYEADLELPPGSWYVAVFTPGREQPVRVGDVVVAV